MVAGFEDINWILADAARQKAVSDLTIERLGAKADLHRLQTQVDHYASLLQQERNVAQEWKDWSAAWQQATLDQCGRANAYMAFITTVRDGLRAEIAKTFGEPGGQMIDEWINSWQQERKDKVSEEQDKVAKEYKDLAEKYKELLHPNHFLAPRHHIKTK